MAGMAPGNQIAFEEEELCPVADKNLDLQQTGDGRRRRLRVEGPPGPMLMIPRNAGNVVMIGGLMHLIDSPSVSGANKRDGRILQTA